MGPRQEYWFDEGCWILELSNSAEDPEASIARARVPPGGVTRWHRVTETTERYVILEGLGRVQVGNRAPRDVGAGDVVLIPRNEKQRIANLGAGDLVFLAICTPRFQPEHYEEA